MGAADVVPGVSGGTIALITHIYERFIRAIDKVSFPLILQLFGKKRKEAWQTLDGGFLLALVLGIGTSILLVSGGILWLLNTHPIPLWSFFFGLILGSAFLLKTSVTTWNLASISFLLAGVIIALGIGLIAPSGGSESLLYLFFCGMLVIIAMILPGISGAFILILLGVYETALEIVEQLKSFRLEGIIGFLVMATGGLIGLKVFARTLRWLFTFQKNNLLATMTGFLIGSLYKVWPWKMNTEFYTNSSGEQVLISSIVVLPNISEASAQFTLAIGTFLLALIILFALENVSKKNHHV